MPYDDEPRPLPCLETLSWHLPDGAGGAPAARPIGLAPAESWEDRNTEYDHAAEERWAREVIGRGNAVDFSEETPWEVDPRTGRRIGPMPDFRTWRTY